MVFSGFLVSLSDLLFVTAIELWFLSLLLSILVLVLFFFRFVVLVVLVKCELEAEDFEGIWILSAGGGNTETVVLREGNFVGLEANMVV